MPRPRDTTMLQADSQLFLIAIGNAGMDLQELSEKSGVGYSTICQMRRGLYMKPWKLGKVCKVLGVKVEDIVKQDNCRKEGQAHAELYSKDIAE